MLEEFRKLGFLRTFVRPALSLFLIPAISLVVFEVGEAKYDGIALSGIEKAIREDPQLDDAAREKALAFFRGHPLSEMLTSTDPDDQQFAGQFPPTVKAHYLSFRWLIRLAWFCIISGVALIALTALSVPLSMRSQRWQYLSLLAGWHSIRLFLTLQVIAQGILVVGLSFWVTALVLDAYSVKLILVAVVLAGVAAFALMKGIFARLPEAIPVAGEVLRPGDAPGLWRELRRVADIVGTAPPDQVVVGIDDNFFVTEHPVMAGGRAVRGKTLFVSLAMLKALSGPEAEAILAHEFAHFSGNDTYYSKRIGPLLVRFNHYLQSLSEAGLARPAFSFALMLRQLYEVSIQKLSRDREFRADAVAAGAVTPRALGDALVRTMAYSAYRSEVERELFDTEAAHERVEIGRHLDAGFRQFAPGFADAPDLREARTAHPFDSHPTLEQRLQAVGRPADVEAIRQSLSVEPDGAWYGKVPDAERRESTLWAEYEESFREVHEHSLIYRYLPSTPTEAAIVARAYPEVTLPAKKKTTVTIDHEKVAYEAWPQAVRFDQVAQIAADKEWGAPVLDFQVRGGSHFTLPLNSNQAEQQRVIQAIQAYWRRCRMAIAYHEERRAEAQSAPTSPDEAGDGDAGAGAGAKA
jgi:Zn-dependent protease with chaperone function